MRKLITIDSGTTNTRIAYVEGSEVKECVKFPVGAGTTAETGSSQALRETIKSELEKLVSENGLDISKTDGIYASGMITSELGLYNLAHIPAPAGKQELKNGSKSIIFEDIAPIPITFIPGIKNTFDVDTTESLTQADVMRGEETELIGLMELMDVKRSFSAVLPGTHNKIIKVDENGRIVSCCTAMSGEVLSAVSGNTILKNSLPKPLINGEPNLAFVDKGYETANQLGINAALFKTRILSNFYHCTNQEKASYFAGVVLSSDICLIRQTAGEGLILLGGSNPLRTVLAHLINKYLGNDLVIADDRAVGLSTIYGAVSIFQ